MKVGDRLALHELAARYGDLIDRRDWPGLGHIFTSDAVYDLTDIGVGPLYGLEAIRRHMELEARHPIAHLITSIYVENDGEQVRLHSRALGVLDDRRVGAGWYRDEVVKIERGWRIKRRAFELVRPPQAAERRP